MTSHQIGCLKQRDGSFTCDCVWVIVPGLLGHIKYLGHHSSRPAWQLAAGEERDGEWGDRRKQEQGDEFHLSNLPHHTSIMSPQDGGWDIVLMLISQRAFLSPPSPSLSFMLLTTDLSEGVQKRSGVESMAFQLRLYCLMRRPGVPYRKRGFSTALRHAAQVMMVKIHITHHSGLLESTTF